MIQDHKEILQLEEWKDLHLKLDVDGIKQKTDLLSDHFDDLRVFN